MFSSSIWMIYEVFSLYLHLVAHETILFTFKILPLTNVRRSEGNLCGPLANFKKSSFEQLKNLLCGWQGKSLYSKGSSDSKSGKLALLITLSANTSFREALKGWTCKLWWICVAKLTSDIFILSCFIFQTLFTHNHKPPTLNHFGNPRLTESYNQHARISTDNWLAPHHPL